MNLNLVFRNFQEFFSGSFELHLIESAGMGAINTANQQYLTEHIVSENKIQKQGMGWGYLATWCLLQLRTS